MDTKFTQPIGSTAKEINKQSIARDFGLKQSNIGYAKKDIVVDSFTLLYEPNSQLVFYKGTAAGTISSLNVSESIMTLITESGSYTCNQAHSYDPVIKELPDEIEKYVENNFSSTLAPNKGILPSGTDVGNGKVIPTLNVYDDPDQRLYLHKVVTNPDDLSVLQISKDSSYTGGTAGFVSTALNVVSTVKGDGGNTYEWAACFVMNNYMNSTQTSGEASVPQQVGIYAQANKYGNSATWASCMEINDATNTSSTGAAIGQEITVKCIGSDATTPTRVGMHISATTNDDNAIGAEWGIAYLAGTNSDLNTRFRYVIKSTGIVGDSVLYNDATTNQVSAALIRDTGSLVLGIDLSKATYSSSAAIRLTLGQQIQLSSDGALNIRGNSAGIVVTGMLNLVNSFALPSTNTATTASAGTAGALPSQVKGYIIVKVDGVNVKIPMYEA